MTDDDEALRDRIESELLLVPGVQRLYPPRGVDAAVQAVAALVGRDRIEGSIGLEADAAVLETALAAARTVRDLLPPSRTGTTVRIRVVAVD